MMKILSLSANNSSGREIPNIPSFLLSDTHGLQCCWTESYSMSTALFVWRTKQFVSSFALWPVFTQTIFSHLALRGGRGAFCHGPKETGGVQVSILSMDFTQGACPRGGTLSSYWNPTGRRKDDSRQGNEETMAAAIYLKGFTPSVCWSGLLLFVLIEREGRSVTGKQGFF